MADYKYPDYGNGRHWERAEQETARTTAPPQSDTEILHEFRESLEGLDEYLSEYRQFTGAAPPYVTLMAKIAYMMERCAEKARAYVAQAP